jgi:hypothetical protein
VTDERAPTHNLEAEQAVLGALLLDPRHAADVAAELDGQDFYDPNHELIWDAAHAVAASTELQLDAITLKDHLERAGALQRIGGAPYLHTLMAACATPGNASYYASQVRNAARLRAVAAIAAQLRHVVEKADPDVVDDAVAKAVDILDAEAGRFAARQPNGHDRAKGALEFHTLPELRKRTADQGPRRWLIRGLWPAGTYGVHAAEQKAQKTWNSFDLAVSVASGTPWLGKFPIDDPGPVIIFAGEGGEGDVLRRLDGIATDRDLTTDELQIAICAKAPHRGPRPLPAAARRTRPSLPRRKGRRPPGPVRHGRSPRGRTTRLRRRRRRPLGQPPPQPLTRRPRRRPHVRRRPSRMGPRPHRRPGHQPPHRP